MILYRYSMGDLIELVLDVNSDKKYGPDDVMGMTITKEVIPTKADVVNTDLSRFIVVHPNEFIFNPRTHGKSIGFGYNKSTDPFIISWNNTAFRIKDSMMSTINPDYLFMHFNRSEWDREACYRSWGSSTEVFSWDALCEMEILLPPLPIQRKYVDVYKAMLANQQSYARGLEDLKLACDATIEELRRKYTLRTFGEYITRVDERNKDRKYKNVKNVSVTKEFSEVSAKVNKDELSNYKIVKPRQITFVQTTHNEHVFCNALNNTNEVILVTSVNEVFECDETQLLPEYLCINFNRDEFDRYARFHSWGSARETFTWNNLIEARIPIPSIEVQKSVADLFTLYRSRRQTNEKLKSQIKDICPILIKGSIEKAQREA